MDPGKLSNAFHASLQRVIVDESPDGILVINQDDEIVSINEQFFVVWGMAKPTYSLDDLLLKPDRNNLANAISLVKDPESFARRVEELYANPDLEDVCEIQLKDGRTLKRHSSPLRSNRGEYLGRVWYFRDITEIINSRLAINASETRYQIVFQTTLDAIAITRLKDGVYMDINDAFIEKTGYRRDELIGKSALELNIWFDPKIASSLPSGFVMVRTSCSKPASAKKMATYSGACSRFLEWSWMASPACCRLPETSHPAK
jgi:PAS domain-containing protein